MNNTSGHLQAGSVSAALLLFGQDLLPLLTSLQGKRVPSQDRPRAADWGHDPSSSPYLCGQRRVE